MAQRSAHPSATGGDDDQRRTFLQPREVVAGRRSTQAAIPENHS
ncbi:MAG: hypothetical protein SOT90_00300 [Muribaculaceae bacterium]|nr:hypothetical protein [Muribaculaceae bacterium]